MSNIPRNNLSSVSSATELSWFLWKKISIHWFWTNENVNAELLSTWYDHIDIKILDWDYKWATFQIDLHIKWAWKPKIHYINCEWEDVYLHEWDIWLTEEFSIQNEIKIVTKHIVKAYEEWLFTAEMVNREFKRMGIKNPILKKLWIKNKMLVGQIISLNQDDE